MALETILWIVAGIVISEIIFIVWSFIYEDEGDDYYTVSLSSSWVGRKIFSFLIGGCFILLQWVIVFCGETGKIWEPHYIRLVYEVIILGVIGVLFFINWLISKRINKSKEKK